MALKNSEERRLLQLQSKELTLRSAIANKQVEHVEVKQAIALQKAKLTKGKK